MSVKGPWKWSESGLLLLDSDGRAVLTIRPSDATEEEFALVEAAPDLRAACETARAALEARLAFCEILDQEKALLDVLRDTLRKARGGA